MALFLAQMGTKLILIARRKSLLLNLKKECEALGSTAYVLEADLSKVDADEVRRRIFRSVKSVDALVLCAGVLEFAPFETISLQQIESIIHLNTTSTIQLIRSFYPYFLGKKHGHFVVIASIAGVTPLPYYQIYAATKHALVGFCRALSLETHKTGLKITCVLPGGVATPGVAQMEDLAEYLGMPLDAPDWVAFVSLAATAKGKLIFKIGFLNRMLICAGFLFPFFERIVLLYARNRIRKFWQERKLA